ncbi:MAG: T9SS type A sorting domain-containing protein [Bacteroidetes bacterium]|nr:T9SS type A sorting domain-containing protein [Bacteroidota bacterium]
MTKRTIIVAVILQAIASLVQAQTGIPSEGREFYVGVPYPSIQRQKSTLNSYSGPTYKSYVHVTTSVDNSVTFVYIDSTGFENGATTKKIAAKQSFQFPLDMTKFQTWETTGDGVRYGTMKITSKAPISVEFVSQGTCSGGSYLSYPLQCWGKNYVVQSYNDNPAGNGGYINTAASRGFIEIVSGHDGTNVFVTPSTTTAGGHVGAISGTGANGTPQPFSVSLNRGQTYTIYAEGKDQGADLSGTVINSSQPVCVLAGHENAFTLTSSVASGTEGRDFMVEQLIPVEAWDSTGYCTIPFYDSKPATTAGYGDEIRAVAVPNAGNMVYFENGSGGSPTGVTVPKYGAYAATNIQQATGWQDYNGKPFGVMQYDNRMQGTSSPYPTPSMVSIIPKSRWKSEYYFYVPTIKDNTTYERYLYLIFPKSDWAAQKILMSNNGVAPSPVQSQVSIKKQFNDIPGEDSLMGIQASITNTGSYYLVDGANDLQNPGKRSKMAAYFTTEVSFNRRFGFGFGGFNANDYYSYGNPLGFNYGEFGTTPAKLTSVVKDNCGKWDVTINDSGDTHAGIRYIEIVNYPKATYSMAITPSVNVQFDVSLDSLNKGEIILDGTQKSYTFTVQPTVPSSAATATIEVYDNSGASLLVNLSKAPSVTAAGSGQLSSVSGNTYTYGLAPCGVNACGAIVLTNPGGAGARDFVVTRPKLTGDTAHFKFASAQPDTIRIAPGSNASIPVCFNPADTAATQCSLILTGDCGSTFTYVLQGHGASGLLQATDLNFAETDMGDTKCDVVKLKNVGTLPLTLHWPVLSDSTDFSVDPAFLATLPVTIKAGDSISVNVCFNPKDHDSHSATLYWKSDIVPALDSKMKAFSLLSGKGYNAGVEWAPTVIAMTADSTKGTPEATVRIYLANRGTSKRILVNSVQLSGPDVSEFSITGNEYGVDPISNFYINYSDSMWLDLKWHPDVTRAYTNRSAFITVNYDVENSGTKGALVIAPINGSFSGSPDGVYRSASDAVRSMVAVIAGRQLTVWVPSEVNAAECGLEVYDLLGRVVSAESHVGISQGSAAIRTFLPELPEGTYIVRMTVGSKVYSCVAMQAN